MQILPAILGWGFILAGALSALFLFSRIRHALRSRHWPAVMGELEDNALHRIEPGKRHHDGLGFVVTRFRYRYTVAGQTYRGRRVTWSDSVSKTAAALRQLQQDYAHRRGIMVYYDPDKPERAVLIPGVSLYNFTPLITSALFVAVGIFLLARLPALLS